MKFKFFLFSILVLLVISSCNRRSYHVKDIDEKTRAHKTVAILPFDIEMTGRMPKNWDDAKKQEVLEQESELFQSSLLSQILNTSTKRRGEFTVSFQNIDKTNAILSKNGITYEVFKEKDPQELAQFLGVDAVLKVKMHKKRYLSNVESYAIGEGMRVLQQTARLPVVLPGRAARTNDVRIVGTLINAEDGNILSNFSGSCGTNWDLPPESVVANISRWIGKKFPYRGK